MYDFSKCLKKKITNWDNHTEGISIQKDNMMKMESNDHHLKLAWVIALLNQSSSSINPTIYTSSIIIDTMFPAQEACSDDSANNILGIWFGIPSKISDINGLYKELPTMKCCVYTIYQLSMIVLSLVINMKSSITCYLSEFHGHFGLI